ncbi:hypothetical protein C8R47DRAFT_1224939 [Mycena vitilis]|nr:hypothetical protein C8R47DRAFT_1224939 [Mycena vitilis]
MPPSRRHGTFDRLLLNDSLFQMRSAARSHKSDAAITENELNAMASEIARYPRPQWPAIDDSPRYPSSSHS